MSGPEFGGLFVRTDDLDDDEILNAVFDAFAEPMTEDFGAPADEIFSAELAPVTFFALPGSSSELYLFWRSTAATLRRNAVPTRSVELDEPAVDGAPRNPSVDVSLVVSDLVLLASHGLDEVKVLIPSDSAENDGTLR